MSTLLASHGDQMTTYARFFAEESQKSSAAEFIATYDKANEMYRTLGPILEAHDVFICPTLAIPALPADFDQSLQREIVIDGKTMPSSLGWSLTSPFNTLSRCPVLAVPSGRAANGVPTGIQIVGKTYSDEDVFQAGLAYETALGGWFETAGGRPQI